MANGKMFVVVGDHEYGGASIGSLLPPVIAPAGNRVGALITESGRPSLLMDGKIVALNGRGVSNLSFTPDGAHYSYLLNVNGSDSQLVIDGVPQPGSSVSKDRANARDSASRYVISSDSKHFAHFATSETASGPAHGIYLDGKFFATALEGNNMELFFSPDSKHLLWVHQYPARNTLRLFIDGKPLVDFASPMVLSAMQNWWDFNADGSLSLLSQDGSSLKRIGITISSETSLDSMGGKSTGSIQARQ
jgi:hypothetical protein